jgi:hypothetical protein
MRMRTHPLRPSPKLKRVYSTVCVAICVPICVPLFACFILFFILYQTFSIYKTFSIPSVSGAPALLVGDFIGASKYFSDVTSLFPKWRVFAAAPKRGDIAVFKLPTDNSTDVVKRVIGLQRSHSDGGRQSLHQRQDGEARIDRREPGGRGWRL